MPETGNCLTCKGRGYLNGADYPGGPTRQISCSECCGTGMA